LSSAVISKVKMNSILKGIMAEYRLIAPVREGKNLVFSQIEKISDIVFSDEITYKSPKEFLFPQVEKLMEFTDNGEVVETVDAEKTVIFGVRPCDLEAFKILAAVFMEGKYVDIYFKKHYENTLLIGVGCKEEKPGCFCSDHGIDMGYSENCDIFLRDDDAGYTVLHISQKGRELLKAFGQLEPDEEDIKTAYEKSSVSMVKKRTLDIEADEKTLFNKIDWGKVSEKCLGCGICTYVCPTCHCFEFKDSVEDGEKVKYRYWDSCMYPRFTLHASGHNPRPTKKERYRQRVLHKYVYIKENTGLIACTGCGRCIRSCPAGMNIKEIVKNIMEEIKENDQSVFTQKG